MMLPINRNPSSKDLRQFAGIWFPLMCLMIGSAFYRKLHWHKAAIAIWCAGGVIAVIGLAAPAVIKPLFVGLMFATYPIGWVVSHVVLAIMYYGVITPIGVLLRAFGRDSMGRRLDPAAATYWIVREPPADVERYFRQY